MMTMAVRPIINSLNSQTSKSVSVGLHEFVCKSKGILIIICRCGYHCQLVVYVVSSTSAGDQICSPSTATIRTSYTVASRGDGQGEAKCSFVRLLWKICRGQLCLSETMYGSGGWVVRHCKFIGRNYIIPIIHFVVYTCILYHSATMPN